MPEDRKGTPFLSSWVNLDIDFHDTSGRRALHFTPRLNPSEKRYVFFFTYVRDMSEIKLHSLRRGRCKRGSRERAVSVPLSEWHLFARLNHSDREDFEGTLNVCRLRYFLPVFMQCI